jgi:hypothetical protein
MRTKNNITNGFIPLDGVSILGLMGGGLGAAGCGTSSFGAAVANDAT